MAIWNVLTKERAGDTETRRAERTVFVREKFSFLALLFAPLVLLRFRLWLALLGYVVVLVALTAAKWGLGLPMSVHFAILAGLHVLVALELPALRAWKLRRTGYLEAGVVVARSREDAEQRFFSARESAQEWTAPAPRPPAAQLSAPRAVIGSFPEPRAS